MIPGSTINLWIKLSKFDIDPTTGCWVWMGGRFWDGYGRIADHLTKRVLKAHRVAFSFYVGDIPPNMQVLHHCDNPPCINPDHLYLGTPKENTRDKVVRKRVRTRPLFGKENPMFGRVGPLNPFWRKKHSPETLARISATKARKKLLSTTEI